MTGITARHPLPWLAVLTLLSLFPVNAMAQDNSYKDGGMLFTVGAGYEYMPDAYSKHGFALDVCARFYTSERFFWELNGHWGTHNGEKNVMQQSRAITIHDERNSLLGAVGPGYEIFLTENRLFDVYGKALIGYGVRQADYDDYQSLTPHDDAGSDTEHGKVTLGCSNSKKGIAAVLGVGADLRHKRWTLTPSMNFIYVGRKWDIATMLSIGYFY